MKPSDGRYAVALVAIALVAAACSSDKQIGSALDSGLFTAPPGGGKESPSPTATRRTTKGPSPTSKTSPSPTRTVLERTYKLRIEGGQCGIGRCGYDPTLFVVAKGTKVIIRNEDNIARTWTARDGTFDIEIPAGGTREYVTTKSGSFPFYDKVTVYSQGEMKVQG